MAQALVAGVSSLNAVATALSSPAVDFLPPWLVKAASTPDEQFRLNASQLALGVGLYAWIAYYMCAFLPYRVLYDEYQDYGRRVAQVRRKAKPFMGLSSRLHVRIYFV